MNNHTKEILDGLREPVWKWDPGRCLNCEIDQLKAKIKSMQAAIDAARAFCIFFDPWINAQSQASQFGSAVKFGKEYQKLHETLEDMEAKDAS